MELAGKRIALLMGGPGSERDISLATGKGVAGRVGGGFSHPISGRRVGISLSSVNESPIIIAFP